jgi:hypothetical protein
MQLAEIKFLTDEQLASEMKNLDTAIRSCGWDHLENRLMFMVGEWNMRQEKKHMQEVAAMEKRLKEAK